MLKIVKKPSPDPTAGGRGCWPSVGTAPHSLPSALRSWPPVKNPGHAIGRRLLMTVAPTHRCKQCGVQASDKASSLDIAPPTILKSGALQPWKWQLTGIDCSTEAQASGCP